MGEKLPQTQALIGLSQKVYDHAGAVSTAALVLGEIKHLHTSGDQAVKDLANAGLHIPAADLRLWLDAKVKAIEDELAAIIRTLE